MVILTSLEVTAAWIDVRVEVLLADLLLDLCQVAKRIPGRAPDLSQHSLHEKIMRDLRSGK
jgi:hypothetical protein